MMVVVCAAGESKLKKATEKKTRIIDEDGLFAIIKASGPPSAASSAGGANGGAAAANKPEPTLQKVAPSPSKKVAPSPSSSAPGPSAHQPVKVSFHRPTLRARGTPYRERTLTGEGGGGMHARKGARALGLMSTPSLGLCSWRPRLMPARTPTHMHAHHGHSTQARRRHQTRSSTPSAKSSVTRTMLTSPRASGSTRCLRQSERLRALAPARWQSLGVAGGCALVCVGIFWRLHA